jgi:hypothetical protein
LPQSLKDSKKKTFKMLFFETSSLRGSNGGNVFGQFVTCGNDKITGFILGCNI